MNQTLNRFKQLFSVQTKEFYRDFGSVFFSLVFPLFFVVVLVVTNSIRPNFQFEIGVVDAHNNPEARKFVEALSSIQGVAVQSVSTSDAEAKLKQGKLHAVFMLPPGRLETGQAEIELVAESRYQGFTKLVLESARAEAMHSKRPEAAAYRVHVRTPTHRSGSEFTFIFPGMLALALLQLGLFATATPLLRARERGTLRYLLLTPLRVHELVICQCGLRFGVALLQLALLLGAGMLVLDLGVTDWLAVLAVSCLGAVMLIAIGYALAGLAPNLEGGMALIMIANFAMMFAGNIFWDPNSATALRYVAYLLPVTYLADLYRQVINHAEGLCAMWVDITALTAWMAAALVVAVKTFRFDMAPPEYRTAALA